MLNEARPGQDERSLGELFGELSQEVSTLVREEATLARAEITQTASRVGKDVGMLAAGGAIAYAGLLALLATIIILLAKAGLDWWASTLLVGVVVAGTGGFLVQRGLQALKRVDLAPRQTVETIKEDAQWARRQAG